MPEAQLARSSKPSHRPQCLAPQRQSHDLSPRLLSIPSETVPGTTTTEHQMLFWVGVFYRLHQRRKRLIPLKLKTVDRSVMSRDGSPVGGRDGQPMLMRCVREVALRQVRGQVSFEVIEYAVGVPGLSFHRCASLDEAMARFDSEPEPLCQS